jgi:amphi-Trp domain-containing protein
MTDETSKIETSETEAPESESAPESAETEVETGEDEEEGEDEDEDEDEDKDKKAKKDKKEKKEKKKKLEIKFESNMPRSEAVSYFEAIVGGLRSGRLEFRQEGDTLVLNPPERLEIEVKAQQKGEKGKIVFEISWSEEHRSLDILN